MNGNRSRIDVKILRISMKTFRESSKLSEQTLSKSTKIHSNLSSTSTDQILDEINDPNSRYFELSGKFISTSTNRIFNLYSTKAFEIFDDLIEKIDFVSEKIDSIFI